MGRWVDGSDSGMPYCLDVMISYVYSIFLVV